MPLYEYYCHHCKTIFEKNRSFSQADEPISCPNCFNNCIRKLSKIAVSIIEGSSSGNSSGCSACTSHNCSNCH